MMNQLNKAYSLLEIRKAEIVDALYHRMFEIESGWYSGHYHRDDCGNWIRESYPIPVVSVKGLCDIEIGFERITVSTKLKRNTVLSYSFDKFAGYTFEAYGVDDYLADYFHAGQTIPEMKDNVRACEEREIGFSFTFPFDTDGTLIYDFAKLLRREGFFY